MKAFIEEAKLYIIAGTTIDEAFDYVKNLFTNPNFDYLQRVTFTFNGIKYTINKESQCEELQ